MEKYEFPQQEREALERLRQPFAIYQYVDKRVVTLVLSDGFCKLFGYEDRARAYFDMDNDMYRETHPDDVARIADAAIRFATKGGKYDEVFRTLRKDSGDYFVVHAIGEHVYLDNGVRLAHVWYTDEGSYSESPRKQTFEISEALSDAIHEQNLIKSSRYDYLTGLPAMSYFFEIAEEGKLRILRNGGLPVLLYIDFSGMKFFNNNYGHARGDAIIQAFAKMIAHEFGNENSCHVSADHFLVLSEEAGLEERLNRIFHDFGEMDGGNTPPIHVGIYPRRAGDVSVSEACDRALLTCNTLKGVYQSLFRYYSPDIREAAVFKQYLVENFDNALAGRWIQVYLQPIIRAVNGQVCEVEALARWIDPERGVISPAVFVPALQDAGLIHRLDLYMVDRILEAIKSQRSEGLYVIPHSINLSRSDFEACDMVEEVRKRVDEAGLSRDSLRIEITESVFGRDFPFIKEQVERFRRLGFPVWLDDFGSGYSSLDVLQSIKFDLIKFDMSFMRKLDEGDAGRIVLTELVKTVNLLGMDTLCEGVESEEQVHFLQEIGCSKLQGFYYSKPLPLEVILEKHRNNTLIRHENPREAQYYESVGRVNLFDAGLSAGDQGNSFSPVAESFPLAVLEVSDGSIACIRSNQSYRQFVKKCFNAAVSRDPEDFGHFEAIYGKTFGAAIRQCREAAGSSLLDQKLDDGTAIHALLRRIAVNAVTGSVAVSVSVVSITTPDEEKTTYADIAGALAADYYNIYLIDLDTDAYIEYSSQVGEEQMSLERHGEDFFASARRDAMTRIYQEDREAFRALFTRQRVLRDIDEHGAFTTTYRIIDTGTPVYVNMKITRMKGGNRLILGVSIIDAHMKQIEEKRKLLQEKNALGRIAALSPNFIVLYTIDPETNQYTQYDPSSEYETFGLSRHGEDFFSDLILDSRKAIAPEDLERHLRTLTKENMLREIEQKGFFTHRYRMIINGRTVPAKLKAAMVHEENGKRMIILGVSNEENEQAALKQERDNAARMLNRTIASLLNNMPGLSFTKDAETGVYVACNQAFVQYAHKAAPEDVFGLTDAQIFDAQTAAHFRQDDLLAMSMDKPYVFYEDVSDAAGVKRQFQTTKFKYRDAYGRLRLQGMCLDVTDMVRVQRENAATRIAYEHASSTAQIYNHLAHALARGCTDLFYVNMQTQELIEFNTDDERGVLSEARRGTDFFESCKREAELFVHPQDRAHFLQAMNPDYLAGVLDGGRVFELTYRRIKQDRTFYVQMKVSRMEDDPRIIVIAVSDIDELMRQRRVERRIQEERTIYARLNAITGNYIVVYVVDPETDDYREFSAISAFSENFDTSKLGRDFFSAVRRDARIYNHPKDQDAFLAVFTKDNVLAEIEKRGIFTWKYRLMIGDRHVHVQLKAAMVEEKNGRRLIVGVNDIDEQVRQEQELGRRLVEAQRKANIDGLTGVKNRSAFLQAEAQMNDQIRDHRQAPFAIVVLDVNDLKVINDTAGHQEGDHCLQHVSRTICEIFKHSPVFRIGGDEFVVIVQGKDYDSLGELLDKVSDFNDGALRASGSSVACGMSIFDDDPDVAAVFKRADLKMYQHKRRLKQYGQGYSRT